MTEAVPNFDRFIAMDRRAVRVYLGFSGLVILVGVLIAGASFTNILVIADADKTWLQELGGGFIAAMSTFPIKEYLARRDRIDVLRAIEERWRQLLNAPETPKADFDRLKEIAWKLYEKGIGG